jgi:hypothetical protein
VTAEWAAYMEQRYAAPATRPEEGGKKGASPGSGV